MIIFRRYQIIDFKFGHLFITWGYSGSVIMSFSINFIFLTPKKLFGNQRWRLKKLKTLEITPVKIRGGGWFSFRAPPDLVYYRFLGSLITNFGFFSGRNWGNNLKFAKTTPKLATLTHKKRCFCYFHILSV